MSAAEENEIAVRNAPQEDWFLQSLVEMANQDSISFGITLNVGGFLISGILISGKEYFEGFGREFSTMAQDKEAAQHLKNFFAKYGEIYKKDSELRYHCAYIHLKDAKYFSTSGQSIPGNRGVWWRGRIAEVQGFVLGSLTAENT